MINRHFTLVALAGLLLTGMGCGDKTPPETNPIVDPTTQQVNPKQAFKAGVDLLNQGKTSGKTDYEKAYEYFDMATTGDPNYAKAHYDAGYCADRLGRLADAETHYRQAVSLDAGNTDAVLALADVLSRNGKTEEAIQIFQTHLEAHPDNLEVRNFLVNTLINAKQYDEAIKQAQEILGRDKKYLNAYTSLARVYFEQGSYSMSQLCAEKAKTLNQGDADIYNAMGVTYLKQGNEPAAIAEFKSAIKLNPKHLDANMNLGWVALNSGDYGLAKNCFQPVVDDNPGNIDALMGLAIAFRGTKDLEKATDLYDKIIKLDPNNATAYFNAATLHEKYTKKYKKAVGYLEAYANIMQGKIGPNDEVYDRIARVQESQKKEDERLRQEEQKKRDEEERKQKQKEQFELMKTRTAKLEGWVTKYASCPVLVEAGGIDMATTVLEQAKEVITQNDFSSASDVMQFFDQLEPQFEELIPQCKDTPPPAPAPAPETPAAPAPVPAPDTPAAPAPETPAAPAPEAPAAPAPVPAPDTPATPNP